MMRLRTRAIAVAVLLGLVLTRVSADRQQTSGAATRDPAPLAVGTGVIAGRVVVDDGSERPLARVVIGLVGPDIRTQPATMTNDDGTFVFSHIPAGRYTVRAAKSGYVTNFFGAKRAGQANQAKAIVLSEGQKVTDVRITLPKGAVISGTFRDQYGRPVPDASINAVQTGSISMGFIGSEYSGRTDDRGMYRIYGLPTGSYHVLFGSSGVSAALMRMTTAEEVQWAEQRSGTPPAATAPVGYTTVYFPGTTDRQNATAITLAAGEERSGVDFALKLVPMTTIVGAVLMPDGSPTTGGPGKPGPEIRLRSVTQGETSFTTIMRPSDGRFATAGMAPGRYVVSARLTSIGSAPKPTVEQMALFAEQELVVDGQAAIDVTLQLQPGSTLKGRVILDGNAPAPSFSRMGIGVTSAASRDAGPSSSTSASDDGTFTIYGVAPGQFRLSVSSPGLATQWSLRSATLKGQDVLDKPFDVRSGEDIDDIVVLLTDRPSSISGRLLDAANQPAPDLFVVVFPVDRALWTSRSRYLRAPARPDSSGRFSVTDLPAGEYYLCALEDYDPDGWSEQTFLESLISGSIKVRLREGERLNQDLRIGKRVGAPPSSAIGRR